MLDEIVQQHWNARKYRFRISPFYLTTADGVEEYVLSKYVDQVNPYTMRGSDPIRSIRYEPSSDFYKKRPFTLSGGDPLVFRDGEIYGVSQQPSASSVITLVSSQSNYTTGTMAVVIGSTRMAITTGSVALTHLGQWIKIGTDAKVYQIVSIERVGTSGVFYIHAPYEEASNGTATYAIGDVQQKAIVLGLLDNGTIFEEEVQLNGSTAVLTTTSFASLIRIAKSGKTQGYITGTSNSGIITNIILDPGETESEFKTVKLYPIPEKTEQINYEAYIKHPFLGKDTDSPLFPVAWHPFLQLELIIKMRSEFLNFEPTQEMAIRRAKYEDELITRANDIEGWDTQQETEEQSDDVHATNLPRNYPGD